ncbi:MAG TPA: glycosyltransferase family 4 protein [Thermoleophilaceae bacterium]|nr:glycosyltransferase family 4 protein [Thermoleophilaceae bacterium]
MAAQTSKQGSGADLTAPASMAAVRVLIFHGYLLRGTGSNVYNLSLVRALAALGHEVCLLCQERAHAQLDLPAGVTVVNPEIGRTLPVYVADSYEGFEAVRFADFDDAALGRYLDANVAAVRAAVEDFRPDVALANHAVMGPAILARGLGGHAPYAVKIHGSALEYTVRPQPERFLPYMLEGLRGASGVLVGSRHTAESLWAVAGDPELPAKTRLGPPGVDVAEFRPRPAEEAAAGLRALADRLDGAASGGWGGEAGAADALRAFDPREQRIVGYVGKLIVSKGVDLLLAAWPLVSARVPDARLLIVGFGAYRDALGQLVAALRRADLEALREIAVRGRALEGGPAAPLAYLTAFLDDLDGAARDAYLAAAPAAAERVRFSGSLEHGDLPLVLPSFSAQVVPSTFPEAFGMVAAEAACCGALPLSADHSGLAEVSSALAGALPPRQRPLLSFDRGPRAVDQIAERLIRWLELPAGERAAAAAALSEAARGRFGWERVAEGVVAAAEGRLDVLPTVPSGVSSG